MKLQRTPLALAAIALLGAAPIAAQAAPTVSFSAPQSGATIAQTSQCEVSGQRIERVVFSLRRSGTSTWTPLTSDTTAPWRCSIDPSKFATGQYTLRAIAYDRNSGGASATTTRTINIARSNTAPSISFRAPSNGTVLPAGGGLSTCEATASDSDGIEKVEFFMNGTLFRTERGAPYTCEFAGGRFPNGTHTLRAVATDQLGATAATQVSLRIGGTTTPPPPTNKAPSVSITRPVAGATLTGPASGSACEATASDSDGSVARVAFTLRNSSGASTAVGSPTAAPYRCAIDTANFANGSYTLMAVATDNAGATTTTQQSLTINKTASGGGTSPIAAADIITRASADLPFSQQAGYTAQVINTYTSANTVPESGIHGAMLPNGETLRFGKTVDPRNSLRRALSFQVRNSDPTTSNGKRSELSVSPNIQMNQTYWITFSAFIEDWGTLAAGDQALFGTQMHTGDNAAGVGGPSFGIYTTQNGRTFRVQGRYSTSSTPSADNAISVRFAEYPIPFGRWVDFVLKFKHNTSGNGLLQVWMDGQQITDYAGNLGYNTGMADYAKFGYYNWSGSAMSSVPRKVLLRAPTIVRDPSGTTYSHDQVRDLLGADAAQ